jgi:hypothetical protein
MSEALQQIDWKVFPKHGWFKGLRSRYERMSDAEKLAWQQDWREIRDWRVTNIPRFADHVPLFDQWYRHASISEVERWEWEILRNEMIQEWLLKITTLLFGRTVIAGLFYYPILDGISVAQVKRDETRVATMRKAQLNQLVG